LRQKLLRTSTVLESCLDVSRGCGNYFRRLEKLKVIASSQAGIAEIEVYISQLKGHCRTIKSIIQQSTGTWHLVRLSFLKLLILHTETNDSRALQLLKIQEFRSEQALRENNDAIRNSLGYLQSTSSDSRTENMLLVRLAAQSQRDSQTLKAFTLVATMYLPATLIAVSSSFLFQSTL
jgi:hypothetical protein